MNYYINANIIRIINSYINKCEMKQITIIVLNLSIILLFKNNIDNI